MMWYNTKVTVELRELVENGVKVWDFEYPSYYKGDAKLAFEQKVLDHYAFRQIGQETPARWLHYFRSRMREIMPYYIQLYESVDLFKSIPDPLQSYELTETFTKEGTSSSKATGETGQTDTVSNERRFSNTPQGSIENLDNYMTEATREDNTLGSKGTSESNVSGSDKETYTLRRFGNIGVQPLGDELKKLREAFLNIDMQIIEELGDLFLKVY